jgi:hypothetical protein
MTSKVYKSAQGKSVDLGTIMLQNEHVRAVGNMKVNARGDKLDSNNRVIETKARQIQKQNDRTTTNVSSAPVHTSSKKVRGTKIGETPAAEPAPAAVVVPQPTPTPVTAPTPVPEAVVPSAPVAKPAPSLEPVAGGLAEAIARSREIKQNLEKTQRQKAQSQGVRKI